MNKNAADYHQESLKRRQDVYNSEDTLEEVVHVTGSGPLSHPLCLDTTRHQDSRDEKGICATISGS